MSRTGQKCIQSFDWEIGKGRNRVEYLGQVGRIILKWSLKKGWEGMDWINPTPGRASVRMVMTVRLI